MGEPLNVPKGLEPATTPDALSPFRRVVNTGYWNESTVEEAAKSGIRGIYALPSTNDSKGNTVREVFIVATNWHVTHERTTSGPMRYRKEMLDEEAILFQPQIIPGEAREGALRDPDTFSYVHIELAPRLGAKNIIQLQPLVTSISRNSPVK